MDEPAVDRVAALDRLASQRFDLLVVGGGIVGAGIAEAAPFARVEVVDPSGRKAWTNPL